MSSTLAKKNKIILQDYPFQKDIEFRSIMSEFTVFEVDVLTEIIHGSLKTKATHLAEALNVPVVDLHAALEKLKKTRLFQMEKDSVVVDKEIRKYWEDQIPKFSDDFRADMEFLKDLLDKVPIHVLPTWYSIPRSSDDIFSSIIEKYLHTPKIYKRYLDDLIFDDPILHKIKDDVFAAPDYKVLGKTIIERYNLSREKFEEYMLYLEFSLVCCISYNKRDEKWEEVITPFSEWRQYLRFQRDSLPTKIEDKSQIIKKHPHDFGFIEDMNRLIQAALINPIPVLQEGKDYSLSKQVHDTLFPELQNSCESNSYSSLLISKMLQMQLIEISQSLLFPRKGAESWIQKSIQERAIAVYRFMTLSIKDCGGPQIDRNLRDIELSLKETAQRGWIYFDAFCKACTCPIGKHEPVMLMKKGKKWKYHTPEYSQKDVSDLRTHLCETLFCCGIVAVGLYQGKLCLSLTPFGKTALE